MNYCIYCGKKLEAGQTACPGCGHEIKEYRAFEQYTWMPVPASYAAEIEEQKAGLFGKGDMKKFAAAVRDGAAATAPVVVEKNWKYTVSDGDDNETEYSYANLAAEDGAPAPRAVRVLGGASVPEGEVGVLLRYTLKKEPIYIVMSKEKAANLPAAVKDILATPSPETVSRSTAATEDSLAGRGRSFLAGLFGKK